MDKLKELSKEINIKLDDYCVDKFKKYMDLLLEWNEKINLTAITEKDEVILKHFIDSMTVLKYIKDNGDIVDVGTGAGFPGIPLSIVKDNLTVTLVDSLNKRINFLNEVKEKIQLENVKTIHSRAEDFGQNKEYREKYDVSVSRAVANLSVLVEYLLPLVKVGGKCICMKGSEVEEEIEEAKFAIKELGGKIESVEEFYLPNTDMKRTIILINKIKKTPMKYPRKPGMPAKQPLRK
ncbi:MAG: 16S rRNA (guanine(527)-N(7))-methyltransferase RsmG [Clostridia bacterium]|nr:16S rRNA (guanine(527)-N(7))-methyltransferase RsmG [Clostridia bacterium]